MHWTWKPDGRNPLDLSPIRLDLPRVVLAPALESDRLAYFNALEAADHHDFSILNKIWRERLLSA